MYASVQTRLEALRSQALSNHYGKLACERYETYKQRAIQLRADTEAGVKARRDALVSAVQGRRDASVEALRERRDRIVTEVTEKKTQAVETVTAQRDRVTKAVEGAQTRVRNQVAERRQKMVEKSQRGVEIVRGVTVAVLATSVDVASKVLGVVRGAAPMLVTSAEGLLETAQPYAATAWAKAEALDARFLSGLAKRVVLDVTEGVRLEREHRHSGVEQAEQAPKTTHVKHE
jgi:hypothetical protein